MEKTKKEKEKEKEKNRNNTGFTHLEKMLICGMNFIKVVLWDLVGMKLMIYRNIKVVTK